MKISNTQLKYIKSLHQSKFRQMYEKFVAEGNKLVLHLLKSQKFEVELIVATQEWISSNQFLLNNYREQVFEIEIHQMEQISALKTSTPVLAILNKSKSLFNVSLIEKGNSFYLDGVQDPGNVGTIIRVADWFGFKSVIRSTDSADFYNPKVVQATMGSMANVDLYTLDKKELVDLNLNLVVTDMNGQEVSSLPNMDKGKVVVLGSEGKGVSDEIFQNKNINIVSIPAAKLSLAESLNVSVAAGIIAYEMSKVI